MTLPKWCIVQQKAELDNITEQAVDSWNNSQNTASNSEDIAVEAIRTHSIL